MPDDDVEIELTLRKYHTRSFDDDSVTEGWAVDAAGLEAPPSGETPEEALRVLAQMIENDGGDGRSVSVDVLADADPVEDEFEELPGVNSDDAGDWEVTD